MFPDWETDFPSGMAQLRTRNRLWQSAGAISKLATAFPNQQKYLQISVFRADA
jgi:hypothetical protein